MNDRRWDEKEEDSVHVVDCKGCAGRTSDEMCEGHAIQKAVEEATAGLLVWLWSGRREELDGDGVTLVCPVVMEADTLREILERAAAMREAREAAEIEIRRMATEGGGFSCSVIDDIEAALAGPAKETK